MIKKLLAAVLFVLGSACASAQHNMAANSWTGSAWTPMTSAYSTGGVPDGTLPAVYLYCYNTGTSQWVPWTVGSCGGGSGTFTALTQDATSTSTGGATTVKGINGTLLSGVCDSDEYNLHERRGVGHHHRYAGGRA
jgi:hypothetical protein